MIDYENLTAVAVEFDIKRGDDESAEDFKARVIYSAVARLGYAGLWVRSDGGSTVSIKSFKARIAALSKIYRHLYPDTIILDGLHEKIYGLYQQTGAIYCKSYRISASIECAAECDGIVFLRGVRPNQKVYVSGAGFYLPADRWEPSSARRKNFYEMFGLTKKILPPIKFKSAGAIVRAQIPWLPPTDEPLPTELFLLRLYGWKSHSRRMFDARVFFALKKIFESHGQKFEEE